MYDTEIEALLACRGLELTAKGESAYSPVYDFSNIPNVMELIYNGVSDECLVKINLLLLARNPWLCYRYDLLGLLDKYNIPLAKYMINEDNRICDLSGKPFYTYIY